MLFEPLLSIFSKTFTLPICRSTHKIANRIYSFSKLARNIATNEIIVVQMSILFNFYSPLRRTKVGDFWMTTEVTH